MQSSAPVTTWNPAIFREYDIRGIAGTDLSPEFAYQLGLAYAEYTRPKSVKRVSVGKDCRLSSDAYADALVRGLSDKGLDVVRLGVCPTPLTYFSVFELGLDGGIMVTGSHNPGDYNGFKIGVGKATLHGEEIQLLRALLSRGQLVAPKIPPGRVTEQEIIKRYQSYLVKHARPLRPLKIVIDAGNGTAATVAPDLFRSLGAKVSELYCTLDGRFPNHHPDPTVPANLKDLVSLVLREKADFGVAFDGDSDRIGLVDEQGRIIFGDEMMVLFARDVLHDFPGATVISEVKSSHRLYQDIAKRGGTPLMWKTGHSLIKSKMKETGAKLAGEMSGHIFFADRYFGFDDAIYAALRVFEIVSAANSPLSSLLADLPPSFTTPEIRVDCREDLKFALVARTKARLIDRKIDFNDIDGVRAEFGDGWGLVRASNTQPVIVMRFEAPSQRRLQEIRAIVEGELAGAASDVGHPVLALGGESSH